MHLGARWLLCVMAMLVPVAPRATAQETSADAQPTSVVLDTIGFWRMHHTLSPPVIQLGDELKPLLLNNRWLRWQTVAPAPDWVQPDFDDTAWFRGVARRSCRTPYLARVCLRGKFIVTDIERVGGLRLSADYRGGIIVYVNGKELTRDHVGPGAVDEDTLAEPYPRDAFVTEGGELLNQDRRGFSRAGDNARRLALRDRHLEDLSIPSSLLRKGVNVLAVEIIRAPYDRALEELKGSMKDDRLPSPYYVSWNTCELNRIQLTAAAADGLVTNATCPDGLRVWTGDILSADFDVDFGDPCEPVQPVKIIATRNGSFSGKVVIGSSQPISGLAVSASDLSSSDAVVPASAVRIRYALPWGGVSLTYPYSSTPSPYPTPATLLSALAEEPLDEFPVSSKEPGRYCIKTPGQPAPVPGAVVPVWITVRVPSDASPGSYTGDLRLTAKGQEPISVPVRLEVVDWCLPDPQDYRTWVELIQSPDTLAVEYDLELWSEEHWDLIGKSLRFLRDVGSRILYVPLLAETNFGNAESMVRWVERGNGKYEFDFSIMNRYLDMAEEHMGIPKIVVFNVWDVYVGSRSKLGNSSSSGEQRALEYLAKKGAPLGDGPIVTVLDPATSAARNVELPTYSDPSVAPTWKRLFSELTEAMRERGLEDTMMLGVVTDSRPTREEVEFFADVAAGIPWVGHSHHGFFGSPVPQLYGIADVAYQTRVWHVSFSAGGPEVTPAYGWKQPLLIAEYERIRDLNSFTLTRWRHFGEYNITGDQRGCGRIGADFWNVIRDKRGQRVGTVSARYPQSSWRNLDLYSSLLAPGPDGPVATTRYEVFREGIQECEARIVIEDALTNKQMREQLGEELAQRCESALDERALFMWTGMSSLRLNGASWDWATAWRSRPGVAGQVWFVGSDWQARTQKLYQLAAEVQRKLTSS